MGPRLLLLALLAAGCARAPQAEPASAPGAAAEPARPAAPIPTLTVEQVAARLDAGVVLYDANPKLMFARGHLPGARWVQFDQVTREVLPADVTTPLIFYCANELCTASPEAARMAVALGYRDVSLMPAGYFGWKQAGKPIEAGAP